MMSFSKEDYEVEEAKSSITLGGNCVAASVAGTVASVTAFSLSGRFDSADFNNTIQAGTNYPNWAPIFFAFLTASIFGLIIRSRGLKTLKNISTKPKLRK